MSEATKNLVIIDGDVTNVEAIVNAISENRDILILAENNGLEEVAAYLAAKDEQYDAIHFITHGGDGMISVNGESITTANLKAEEWAAIGSYLTDEGDLLFYGCELAKSAEGKSLIDAIAAAANADAAASINLTGKDGDWQLEYVSGDVESPTITVDGYDGNLGVMYFKDKTYDGNQQVLLFWDNSYHTSTNVGWCHLVYKNDDAYDFTNCIFKNKPRDYQQNYNWKFYVSGTTSNITQPFYAVNVHSSTFRNNFLALSLGAKRRLYVDGTLFEYNGTLLPTGPTSGGAIYSNGYEYYNSTNKAFYDYRSKMYISTSTFQYNVAGTYYTIDTKSSWSTWSNNVKSAYCTGGYSGRGGAIYCYMTASATDPDSYKYNKNYGLDNNYISSSKFYRNSAIVDGGAIWTHRGWFQLTDCSFIENTAGLYSYLELGQKVMKATGTIDCEKNAAGGGAIAAVDSSWFEFMTNTTFTKNQCQTYGGAIYVSTPAVENTSDPKKLHILKHVIKGFVVAVEYIIPGPQGEKAETAMTIDRVAESVGKAVDKTTTKKSIKEIITCNGSTDSSDGSYNPILPEIYFHADATFDSNKALEKDGGAISLRDQGIAIIEGSAEFTGNSAGGCGGAVSLSDNNIFVCAEGVTCTNNTASSNGGAFYINGTSTVGLGEESVFTGNIASYKGGAICAIGAGSLSGDGSPQTMLTTGEVVFDNNSSGMWGGACYLSSVNAHFMGDVTISNNTTTDDGGGMKVSCNYRTYGSTDCANTIFYGDVTITGNTANRGGGLYVDRDSGSCGSDVGTTVTGTVVFYKDVTFTGNVAKSGDNYGNAMYICEDGWVRFSADMILNANQTVVVNYASLEWDITRDGGKTAYVNDYSLITFTGGALGDTNPIITINMRETAGKTSYILAGNAANARNKYFWVEQGLGGNPWSICANGYTFGFGGKYTYTLGVNSNNQLVLNVVGGVSKDQHEVIAKDEKFFTDGYFSGYNKGDDYGGVFYINANGFCDLYNATLTGNYAVKGGGAIYNQGTLYLTDVTINGNKVANSDSAKENGSGIYNDGGTVVFAGNVTCSDYIASNGGTINWAVNNEKHGYLSDFNKLYRASNAVAYTITVDPTTCTGAFKLASNVSATAVDNVEFTVYAYAIDATNGLENKGQQALTVNGSSAMLEDLYNITLYTDKNNDLWFSVSEEQIVVNKANYKDTNGVLTVKEEQNIVGRSCPSNGGVVAVEADGTLNNTAKLTFQHCVSNSRGGVIYNQGVVSLIDATFSDNISYLSGGAIFNDTGSKTSLSNVTFSDNNATDSGGAIYNKDCLTLANASFNGNLAESDGGAIYNIYSTMTITDSTFTNNTAKGYGGAIYNIATAILDNVTFSGNDCTDGSADAYGGAIYNGSGATLKLLGDVTLATSTDYITNYGEIEWVIAKSANGYISDYGKIKTGSGWWNAVTFEPSQLYFGKYKLASNASNAKGQSFSVSIDETKASVLVNSGEETLAGHRLSLYTDSSNELWINVVSRIVVSEATCPDTKGVFTIENGLDCSNLAYSGNGGVILVESDGTLNNGGTINFSNNSATGDGGVIYNDGGKVTLTDATFSGNSASTNGGGIYNREGIITLADVTFTGNTALYGGAVYNTVGSTLRLAGDVTLTTDTDNIISNGKIEWVIGLTDYGYLSDFSQISGDGSLAVTIDSEGLTAGLYMLASSAAAADGKTFTVSVGEGDSREQVSLTVNGSAKALASLYNITLLTDENNDLWIFFSDEQIVVSKANFPDTNGVLTIKNERSIVGRSSAKSGIIQVNSDGMLNNTAPVSFSDCTSEGNGGVINNSGETLLTNATFNGNSARGNGGVINNSGETLLTNAIFSDNSARGNGGAIYNNSGETFVTNATFSGNSTRDNGGAIYINSGTVTITDSTFSNNTTKECGGAIYNNGTVILGNVTFSGNSDSGRSPEPWFNGGAIFNNTGKTLKLSGDVILATGSDLITNYGKIEWMLDQSTNGYLSNYGGINNFYDWSYAVTFESSQQYLNKYKLASKAGHAKSQSFSVSIDGATANISVNGGEQTLAGHRISLYTDSSKELWLNVVSRIVVSEATCQDTEGVFTIRNGLDCSSLTYIGNGGVILVESDGTLNNGGIINFSNNSATGDGGVIYNDGGNLTLADTTFSGNSATNGGAIYSAGGSGKLTNATFSGNNATGDGGAIYLSSGADFSLADVVFTDNSATGAGGAIYIAQDATLNVAGTITLVTDEDTICNNGTVNWDLTNASAENFNFSVTSNFTGSGEFVVTISDDGLEKDVNYILSNTLTTESQPAARSTSVLTDASRNGTRYYTIKNQSGDVIGVITENNVLVSGKDVYRLDNIDGKVTLSVVEKITNFTGDSEGLSWDGNAKEFTVQVSPDNFETVATVFTSDDGVNFYGMPEGDYQAHVKNSFTTVWTDQVEITSEYVSEQPVAWKSKNNNRTDIFFASATGIWDDCHKAYNAGISGGWTGTQEIVSLTGKNRLADTFAGSDDANILLLTDDDNGDVLFMDDIYTEFPAEQQARIAKINQIRAGAGDDIVDLTSQRYGYIDGVIVRGGEGDDVIWAGRGDNFLCGDDGNDRIVGASGNDVIVGGSGNDSMNGGGGSDTFCFCENWGQDTVKQLDGGTVTLWFKSGDESNWNQETMTYTDGDNTVKVSGVSEVSLKFGDDQSTRYVELAEHGAFLEASSKKIYEDRLFGALA